MGYQKSATDAGPPDPIELRSISKKNFELMTAFAYEPRTGPIIEVPTHPNQFAKFTDLASVPPLLWGLLPSYGRQLRAALLHDHLCDQVNWELRRGMSRRDAYPLRRRADDLFYEGMRDMSAGGDNKRVGWFRAKLFWVGVSYGRYWKLRRLAAFLMTLQVAVGVLAMDRLWHLPPLPWLTDFLPGTWSSDGRLLLLIWVLAVAASVLWRRDAQVPLIGLVVGPLVLPVLLVTFLAQLGLGLPDYLLHRFGRNQPPSNFGPTVASAQTGYERIN